MIRSESTAARKQSRSRTANGLMKFNQIAWICVDSEQNPRCGLTTELRFVKITFKNVSIWNYGPNYEPRVILTDRTHEC